MPNFIEVEFSGGPELQKALNQLPEAVQERIVKKAMKTASSILMNSVKSRVPFLSGALSSGLEPGSTRKKNGLIISAAVRTPTRAALGRGRSQKAAIAIMESKGYYPMSQEYGSSRNRAQPFMRPAMAACKGKIIFDFEQNLKAAIQKAMAKLPGVAIS